jgi:diaminopimelate epimerase
MKFWKYHGLGNDFIILDNLDGTIFLKAENIEAMCHRRFGIGADGVVLAQKSDIADLRMIIYNSDGSRAEMCGNAIRCFSKYAYDHGIISSSQIDIETDAGVMKIDIVVEKDKAAAAIVNMGRPDFDAGRLSPGFGKPQLINEKITVEGEDFHITSLTMGVPHTVIFTDNIDDEYVQHYGRLIENHPLFPGRTNVNFVKIINRDSIIIRTWERGAGYTYACGTGACACVAAGAIQSLINDKVKVQLRGGELVVHWRDRGDIYMQGPAAEVFEGFYTKC